MAVKNNVDIFYFAVVMGIHVFFCDDGAMDKRIFLSTWKDIPSQNEVQFNIENVAMNAGTIILFILILCISLHIATIILFILKYQDVNNLLLH